MSAGVLLLGPLQRGTPPHAALKARSGSREPTTVQASSKADPKAVSAHGVAAAMAADSSRPLDMLIIANRLEAGASDYILSHVRGLTACAKRWTRSHCSQSLLCISPVNHCSSKTLQSRT